MTWTWRYDGPAVAEDMPAPRDFTSQADAETWLGETWRELAEAGVTSVTLLDDGAVVYPMSLESA